MKGSAAEPDDAFSDRGSERLLNVERVMTTHGLTSMRLARYSRLIRTFEDRRTGALRYHGDPKLFAMANVRYFILRHPVKDPGLQLVSDGSFKVYENRHFLERAFFVSDVVRMQGSIDQEIGALGAISDPSVTIVLHEPESTEELRPRAEANGRVRVDTDRLSSRRIEMDVECDGPGYVYYAEIHYPGWRAWVDGREVPIHRANVSFMAVPIDAAGHHKVVLSYWPTRLNVGLAGTALGLVVLFAAAALERPLRPQDPGLRSLR
jgi:hypothetical protein